MRKRYVIPDDLMDTLSRMSINQAADHYEVSSKTIKRWKKIIFAGEAEQHNEKARMEQRMLNEREAIRICLSCKRVKCTGRCDKFPH